MTMLLVAVGVGVLSFFLGFFYALEISEEKKEL